MIVLHDHSANFYLCILRFSFWKSHLRRGVHRQKLNYSRAEAREIRYIQPIYKECHKKVILIIFKKYSTNKTYHHLLIYYRLYKNTGLHIKYEYNLAVFFTYFAEKRIYNYYLFNKISFFLILTSCVKTYFFSKQLWSKYSNNNNVISFELLFINI